MDLFAAFDITDNGILPMRLSITFDITYLAVQCLHFHIIERFMTFIVKDITSEPKRLDFGVPQGSALGPLLFVLHTHPISQIVLLTLDLAFTDFLTILSC